MLEELGNKQKSKQSDEDGTLNCWSIPLKLELTSKVGANLYFGIKSLIKVSQTNTHTHIHIH